MNDINVFYGVSRTVPASSLRVARALKDGGLSMTEVIRALRRMYDLDLAAARGICWGICPSNVWEAKPPKLNSDNLLFENPIIHGNGWYFCRDNWCAWEDHWASPPQEQLRSSGRDLLF